MNTTISLEQFSKTMIDLGRDDFSEDELNIMHAFHKGFAKLDHSNLRAILENWRLYANEEEVLEDHHVRSLEDINFEFGVTKVVELENGKFLIKTT